MGVLNLERGVMAKRREIYNPYDNSHDMYSPAFCGFLSQKEEPTRASDKPRSQIEDVQYHKDKSLAVAAINGNLRLCEELLESGANIEAFTNYGSVLGCAVKSGNVALCRFLILKRVGVDIRERTDDETPLMMAAEIGNLEMCELLLYHGADPNALRGTKTLLSYARQGQKPELTTQMVSLLKEHGLHHTQNFLSESTPVPEVRTSGDSANTDDVGGWCCAIS